MTPNERLVARYMEGFGRSDPERILSCRTDDVYREIPGAFRTRGPEAFAEHIENEAFVGGPDLPVTRMTKEGHVVVAEGMVRTERRDGSTLNLAFRDVLEMRDGRIARLVSYLVGPR